METDVPFQPLYYNGAGVLIMRLFILPVLLIISVSVFAEKEVKGILNRDTRWNADEGPYRLSGDIVVARNIRLTIAPGCRISVASIDHKDTAITQYDKIDSRYISIKVYGTLICIGSQEKRTVFAPDSLNTSLPAWYGIVLDGAEDQFTEIAHTDITGAYNGITVRRCAPLIHHTVIIRNHTGLLCSDYGSATLINCLVGYNTSSGIRIDKSNPEILNSMVIFNRNNGLWCDGASRITFTYNCIFGNGDGDLLDCDPEIGLPVKKNKNGDSIDIYKNLRLNPIFSGSPAEAASRRQDPAVPTPAGQIRNPEIAAIVHDGSSDSSQSQPPSPGKQYELSEYSPCRDAGEPSSKLKDRDGSRNDIGIYGGPPIINHR